MRSNAAAASAAVDGYEIPKATVKTGRRESRL